MSQIEMFQSLRYAANNFFEKYACCYIAVTPITFLFNPKHYSMFNV